MMKKVLASVAVSAFPLLALAQGGTYTYNGGGIGGLITQFRNILNALVPLILALAVVYFLYEVFIFISTSDETKKAVARTGMVWGIVGIFVMVSVWGLVGILASTFGTAGVAGPTGGVSIPTIPQ